MSDKISLSEKGQAWVCVVDDEENARRSLTEILRLEGYQVEGAANATQAIQVLKQKTFDVILLDLRMPDTQPLPGQGITDEQAGLKVLRFAADHMPDTPVIFLTAHGSLETAIEALRYSALDYLLKPATPEEILAALEKALLHRKETLRKQAQEAALNSAKSIASEMSQSLDKLGTSLQALRSVATGNVEDSQTRAAPLSPAQTGSAVETQQGLVKPSSQMHKLEQGMMIDLIRREMWKSPGDQTEFSRRTATLHISLTPTEGKMMEIFVENPGRVFTHRELITLVQGYEALDSDATEVLRPLISRLRRKLELFPGGRKWIRSIRGTGYMFELHP